LLTPAIEEFLRHGAPASTVRTCIRDTTLGNQSLAQGDKVFAHLPAASRDPAIFDAPHDVDLERSPNHHLAFGAGAHHCVGSHFARLLLRVGLEVMIERVEDLRLSPGEFVTFRPGQTRTPGALRCQFARRVGT
jgi:cytochrome P450